MSLCKVTSQMSVTNINKKNILYLLYNGIETDFLWGKYLESCTVVTSSLAQTWIFPLRCGNRKRSFHSELSLINQPTIECFFAKCSEKIKSSSRKWGEGTIIVESFIYHSQQSCWRQDNYTICSQTAAKNLSLLRSESFPQFPLDRCESIQFIFFLFFWLAIFPSDVSLMNISWKCSGIWAALCLAVWNWRLRQWTAFQLGSTTPQRHALWIDLIRDIVG